MPVKTVKTTKPLPFEQGPVDHVVGMGQNLYGLRGGGLLYTARNTNFAVRHMSFAPDGTRFAIITVGGTALQMFYDHYPVSGLAQPSSAIATVAGGATEVRFAPGTTGPYIAASHGTTPFVSIYNADMFVKLTNPGTLPAGTGSGIAWSVDGDYLAVAHTTTPFMTVYQVTRPTAGAEPTFTKLTNPGTLPLNDGHSCAWGPLVGGVRPLVIGTSSGVGTNNALNLYTVTGTTITFRQVQLTEDVEDVCFSPSGKWVALVTAAASNQLRIYRFSATAVTLLNEMAFTLPGSPSSCGVTWTADEKYVIAGNQTTPFLQAFPVYDKIATPLVALPNPSTLPTAGTGRGDCFPIQRNHQRR